MQKTSSTAIPMLLSSEQEIFDQIISQDHPFRKLDQLLNWKKIIKPLRELYSDKGRNGYDIEKGFKAIVLQYWEDYSDREMERALRENLAVKWFCGFSLLEKVPDHSYFGDLRRRIGPSRLAKLFNRLNTEMEKKNLLGNVFAVIDASALITKTALWEERDRAISDGNEKLNNSVVSDYATDKDAKWGIKGKNKVWFGYKRHMAIDTRFGLIRKTSITPANSPDFRSVENISQRGMIYLMDKGYDYPEVDEVLRAKGSASGTIRKNNNPKKDEGTNSWRTVLRMPYEGVFSKLARRTRYKGQLNVMIQNYLEAIVHNLKKMVTYCGAKPKLGL